MRAVASLNLEAGPGGWPWGWRGIMCCRAGEVRRAGQGGNCAALMRRWPGSRRLPSTRPGRGCCRCSRCNAAAADLRRLTPTHLRSAAADADSRFDSACISISDPFVTPSLPLPRVFNPGTVYLPAGCPRARSSRCAAIHRDAAGCSVSLEPSYTQQGAEQ